MEETRTPIFSQQLSDLSTLTGKLIKHFGSVSGESHKCFVLTLNYLLTTNRTTDKGGGGHLSCGKEMIFSGRHTGSLSWYSISWPTTFSSTFHCSRPSASKSLLCRMDWVPGPSSLLGLTQPGEQGAFMEDHRCLNTKWQFSSSIIPCYCITRSYREASISFLRF